jgi:glycerol kinase
MPEDLVLAIDQGTSSTKCILVDATGAIVSRAAVPISVSYPRPGWVEQDPDEIVASVLRAATACLDGHSPGRLAAIGLSNQRESLLLWDTATGRPVSPLIGWQDRRAAALCERLRHDSAAAPVRRISGLPLDPMFSAPKISWLLDEYDPDRTASRAGRLAFGTVDAWIIHTLVGGHRAEIGNASRTQLLDISSGMWSKELLTLFDVPVALLPEVVPSSADLGRMSSAAGVLVGVPLRAVLGDSHAALYAHGVQAAGAVKVTYGTGSSAMRLVKSAELVPDGVCATVAWADPALCLAAEGNIRSTGATVAWLAGVVGMTPEALADEAARSSSDGVYLVPAFGGLAAPWWDDAAVGLIGGVTLGSTRAHLARAAIESIAFQIDDVVQCMVGAEPVSLLVADGGGSSNDGLLQFQADITGVPVRRAMAQDLSALGAASMAGTMCDLWSEGHPPELQYTEYLPSMSRDEAAELAGGWRRFVGLARRDPRETP